MENTERNISVFDLVSDAFQVFWNNKVLWLVGILFSITGGSLGGGGMNFSAPSYSTNQYNGEEITSAFENTSYEPIVENLVDQWQNFANSAFFWPVLWTLGIIAILWILVSIYVGTVSKNALIKAEKMRLEKKELTFKSLWKAGNKGFWKIILIAILGSIGSLGLVIFMFVVGIISIPLVLCCVGVFLLLAGVLVSFAGGIALNWMQDIVLREVLLDEKGIWESIEIGFNLVKDNIGEFLKYLLVNVVLAIAYGIVSVVMFIPTLIVSILAFAAGAWILVPLPVLAFVLLNAGVTAPFLVVSEIWKTKFWYALKEIQSTK